MSGTNRKQQRSASNIMLNSSIYWMKRIFKLAILVVATLISIGFLYESYMRSKIRADFPPPGELADLGSHRLHYVKTNLEVEPGSPTVVFESGLDQGGHLPWRLVQQAVSEFAPTISYDRAGILHSERGPNPKTASDVANELHELLEATRLNPPYILVGHSLAGVLLPTFVNRYPDEVAGIVFVDVSHPDQRREIPELPVTRLPPAAVVQFLFRVGIGRLLLRVQYASTEQHDPMNLTANGMLASNWQGMFEENIAVNNFFDAARSVDSFGEIPLTVISGTEPTRFDNPPPDISSERLTSAFMSLQEDLLNLSSRSKWIFAENSYHYVQLEEPDLVVNAIREVMEEM